MRTFISIFVRLIILHLKNLSDKTPISLIIIYNLTFKKLYIFKDFTDFNIYYYFY